MQTNFINELKNRITIIDVVSTYVKLKRTGTTYTGLCPFHNEKTPSFSVLPDKGIFHCFGCGATGDIITFVMKYENFEFKQAVLHLAQRYSIEIPTNYSSQSYEKNSTYDVLNVIKNFYIQNLQKTELPTTNINLSENDSNLIDPTEYLKQRNITQESIENFEIGFATNTQELLKILNKDFTQEEIIQSGVFFKNNYGTLKDKFYNRLIFPIFDQQSRCIGFGGRSLTSNAMPKYLNSPETSIFIKSKLLYGLNLARKKRAKEIIVCEGYLDVISLHQAGFHGAVSTLGTSFHEQQMQLCWQMCNTPIIALDGDTAGIRAAYKWIDKILSNISPGKSFKFAIMPENCDPDDMIRNGRIQEIQNIFQNAIACINWLIDGAFYLHPHSTPEELAYIFKLIEEKILLINDIDIKKFYRHFVFEFKKHKQHVIKINQYEKSSLYNNNFLQNNFKKTASATNQEIPNWILQNDFNINNLEQNILENQLTKTDQFQLSSQYHSSYNQSYQYKQPYDPKADLKYDSIYFNTTNKKNIKTKPTIIEKQRKQYQLQQILSQETINKKNIFENILIVILVNYLKIIDDVIENFVTIEYNGILQKIQDYIKNNYLQHELFKENILKAVGVNVKNDTTNGNNDHQSILNINSDNEKNNNINNTTQWNTIENDTLLICSHLCKNVNFFKKNNINLNKTNKNIAQDREIKDNTNNTQIITYKSETINENEELQIILDLWNEIWQQYFTLPKLKNDLQSILEKAKSGDVSLEQWNKLKILKNEILKQKAAIKLEK